ncbi:hypothetical protein E2C01_001283 [Portunus trituberculatus]|uniref:Uncharacterized protein n=1 Tax=Portunus trituberculatus TaxID=210409 RepID=A0A5B7CH84_PORTR|nr:hypothetical protein [Portunus trituberculatus]
MHGIFVDSINKSVSSTFSRDPRTNAAIVQAHPADPSADGLRKTRVNRARRGDQRRFTPVISCSGQGSTPEVFVTLTRRSFCSSVTKDEKHRRWGLKATGVQWTFLTFTFKTLP